jgi:class 3 adenylate cyclase
VLQDYYRCLGESIDRFEGTLEHFAGDGIRIIFNDPIPCEDPCARAVCMAVEMREHVGTLAQKWRRFGYQLGFGVGIAAGHATLGSIGYEGRFHYSATGQVVNLAARLCARAADGQILVDGRVQVAVEPIVGTDPVGELELKGFHRPIRAFNVRELKA